MFWIALAAALVQSPPTSPYTGDPRGLFRADDYPAIAQASGEQGTVVADLVIDTVGRVESCNIAFSSKSPALDRATCDILRSRARFRPAKDDNHAPIYSVVRTPPITWSLEGPGRRAILQPDVELEISQAPAALTFPIEFSVEYVVKTDGKVASCGSLLPPAKAPAELVAIACDPAMLPPLQILRNNAGDLVDAKRTAVFRFVAAKP